MKIYRPIKPNYLTQKFGENAACAAVDSSGKIIRPFIVRAKQNNTCPVGYKDFYPLVGLRAHPGEDWSATRGEKIYFDVDIPGMRWWGRVEVDEAQGINLDIFSVDPIPFETLPKEVTANTLYHWDFNEKKLHIKRRFTHGYRTFLDDKPLVQVGVFADGRPEMRPEIKLGDLVMLADNTGASAGDHLHRSIKFTTKNAITIGGDNGYMGAVDEAQWFDNRFVLDVLKEREEQPTTPPLSQLDLTLQSLENNALEEEQKGNPSLAAIIRAIKGIVKAFWK